MENVVFLELKRKGKKIFYADPNGECDFIIKGKNRKNHAVQVTWELGEHNKQREIEGLVKTCEELAIKEAEIITFNQQASYEKNNVQIKVIPFYKWLLQRNQRNEL